MRLNPPRGLLATQHRDRIHAARSPRRDRGCKQANCRHDPDYRGEGDGVVRLDGMWDSRWAKVLPPHSLRQRRRLRGRRLDDLIEGVLLHAQRLQAVGAQIL